jgi:membrane-bound serine protease (ClpP class)
VSAGLSKIGLLALLALLVCVPLAAARDVPDSGDGKVLVAPLTGAVDPVMLEFTTRVLDRAKEDGYDAVVFELDTPGGLSTSMDDIVRRIVAADVPVYVYVSPTGGRAASAGVFITYASDVAAMAPGTNIGSATPINSNGEELPKDLRRKVINDAVAKITELAKERGRNEQFAEEAITKAENVGAREALRTDVVDYIAKDVRGLLEQSDGSTVKPKNLTLHLADAKVDHMEVSLTLRVLKHLVDPNVLFLLFGAGLIGLAFELTHPGVVLPGVAGGICLLLALFGLSVLPATGAGIALLVLAAALFAAEAVAPGGGVLGGGGAVALLLGALLLFDDSSGYGVSTWLAVLVAGALAAFFGLVLRKAIATRRLAPATGGEGLAGLVATVRRPISPDLAGMVFVDGELWRARAAHAGEQFEAEDRVRVVRMVDGEVEIEALAAGARPAEGDPQ